MSSEADAAAPRDAAASPDAVVAVIAAAGSGERFGSVLPKQYVELEGRCLLERSVRAMLAVANVRAVIVALAPRDARFADLEAANDPRVHAVEGAGTRARSVAAALAHVRRAHGDTAWALVHDAARPLVAPSDVHRLIERVGAVRDPGVGGGILATRVADTLKRERPGTVGGGTGDGIGDGCAWIEATVPRAGLWGAQTPQLFRAGALHDALASAQASLHEVTDEASAMERAGVGCLLVESVHPNPKITWPADMAVARALVRAADAAGAS